MNQSNVILNKVYPDNQVIQDLDTSQQIYLISFWNISKLNRIDPKTSYEEMYDGDHQLW